MALEDRIKSATEILQKADSIALSGFKFLLFSGGKDSIVAAHLAKNVLGINQAFCEESLLPKYLSKEVHDIGAEMGLNVKYSCRLTPKLFSRYWYNQIPPKEWKPHVLDRVRHWKSIPRFAKQTNATMMVFGRRTQENIVRKPIYYKQELKTTLQVHPLWDWKHEDVWEYIERHKLPYPSCYKDGSKHLLTWVSLAQIEYRKTQDMSKVYSVIDKHSDGYLEEMRNKDIDVLKYLSQNGKN